MSTTFRVSEVEPRLDPDLFLDPITKIMEELGRQFKWKPFEAFSHPMSKKVVWATQAHGFWSAIHTSFRNHIPLGLSPDHVWLTIARTFAEHVVAHAEELRKRFVDFEGQKEIEIQRDYFVKGSKENDWNGVFAEFSDRIADNIGKARDLVVCDFTTTGPVEKAASQIVLMDAMQRYFQYTMRTLCGIPTITLYGEVKDWVAVRARAQALSEYGLADWVKELDPVLEKFVAAATGEVDTTWWQSFYKYSSSSGSDRINGHFTKFFVKKITSSDHIPHCISQVPFTWKYYSETIPMRFIAGMPFATIQDGVVQPLVCWGVNEA